MSVVVTRRGRLIATWGLLAALLVFIASLRHQDTRSDADGHGSKVGDGVRWLLPAPIESLGAIEVVHAGALHRFERDASGAWLYHGAHAASPGAHQHQADPAMAARIGQVLTGFGRTRIERSFPLEASPGSPSDAARQELDYGLARPSVVILVYEPGALQPRVQYAVGRTTPDGFGRYLLPIGHSSVVTIANYQITGLLALIEQAAGVAR